MVGQFDTSPLPLPPKEESRVSGQLGGVVEPLRVTDLNTHQPLAEIGSRVEVTNIGVFYGRILLPPLYPSRIPS